MRGSRGPILMIATLLRKNFLLANGIANSESAKNTAVEFHCRTARMWFDFRAASRVNSTALLGGRPMVGLQTLDLAIGVRVPASQPTLAQLSGKQRLLALNLIDGVDYSLQLS